MIRRRAVMLAGILFIASNAFAEGDPAVGKTLFAVCQACHGPGGEGNQQLGAPRIAGQKKWYLLRQIRNFRAGARGVDPKDIDDVIMGCAMPEGEQGLNVARLAGMRAGLPHTVPGFTVNRFCASGLESIAIAASRIALGQADVILAGGVESMSLIPMGGNKPAPNPVMAVDYPEAYIGMGNTAERVAEKYNVTREEQDAFALRSHQRAADAIREGEACVRSALVDIRRHTGAEHR